MDCIFCKIAQKELESKIIYEDEIVLVIMDTHPTVDGHCLIIPKKHFTDYQELDTETISHIFKVAQELGPKILQRLNAQSLTMLINYGESQKVKHFHLHLLPNFGPVEDYNTTKSIEEIYEILK